MSTTRRQFLGAAAALASARAAFTAGIAGVRGAQETADKLGDPRSVTVSYGLDPEVTYLNHASIGTMPTQVLEAHVRYLRVCEENPWEHVWGGAWVEALGEVGRAAGRALQVEPHRVAIVRNTTAAFGMAANGLPIAPGSEVLFSGLNHTGASASFEAAAGPRGYSVRRVDFPEADIPAMSRADVTQFHLDEIRDATEVLVLPHIDNVYGVRHDVRAIAQGARERGVRWVLVDGAQSAGMIGIEVAGLGVDLFATSTHKWFQGPKGTGLMALSDDAIEHMRPLVESWGAERAEGTAARFTDFGTRDLPKILALGDALGLHRVVSAYGVGTHQKLRARLREAVELEPLLEWRSPDEYEGGGALHAIGLRRGSARAVAKALFEKHGIVVRGFEGDGRNHLRVSPNQVVNRDSQLDDLIAAVRRLLGG